MLRVGELVAGRYRIDELLGEGGFSAVYGATDVAGERPVALKCLKPDSGASYDGRTRARFQREVEMVARLRSPHTVRLFDYGESDAGLLYMVFERVPGEDLDEMLRRIGRLDVPSALHVLHQLLDAVSEAHQQNLLHRDIKSSNVRVTPYMGDPLFVKLLDFGLARGTDGGHPSVTATGEFIGTPRYMAPEQFLDEDLTPATDIYCLGLVAYEMLLGPDVLSSNSVHHQIDRLRTGHLIAPRAYDGVPPHVAAVLERMTAREPGDRFQSASAVRDALIPAAQPSRPPQAPRRPPPSTASVSTRPTLPSWMLPALVLLGFMVAGLLAGLVVTRDKEPRATPPPDRPAPAIVHTATTPPVAPEPDVATGSCPPRRISGYGRLSDPFADEKWLAYVPKDLPLEPAPAVILLHQNGHGAEDLLRDGGFMPPADEFGFIVLAVDDEVYAAWKGWPTHMAEVKAMRDEAIATLCVDPGRIFLVGHGGGSPFAARMACDGWARGLATHALARERGRPPCDPVRPLPYAQFYPKKSGYEPYNGGLSTSGSDRESWRELEARWRQRNRCERKATTVTQHGNSECYTFECETPYLSCHVDGGHGWPGTRERSIVHNARGGDGPPPDSAFPMARLILEFFSKLEPLDPIEPTREEVAR